MKRFLLYAFLGLGSLPMLTGCYEDKSTEAEFLIPEIEIDTVGFNAPYNSSTKYYTIYVQQNEKLQLSFPVKQEGTSNPNFSHEWKLTLKPETSGGAELDFMTISEKAELEYVMDQTPNSKPYILWYQVTDNNTGIKKGIVWAIQIMAPYNEGLLVAESNDGNNTDIAFIASDQFTNDHSGVEKISHNIYTTSNSGSPIQGLVKQMAFYRRSISGQGVFNHLLTIGNDFYQHIDNGFKYAGRNNEVSYDDTQTFAPTQISHYSSSTFVLINEGKLYAVDNAKLPYLTVCAPERFTHPNTGQDANGTIDKYVAMRRSSTYTNGIWSSWACWYDKTNEIFMYQKKSGPSYQEAVTAFPTDNYTIFDPNNAPNLDTRGAGLAMDNKLCLLMKNLNTNNYQVYVFTSDNTPVPVALYNIPETETEILDAAHTFHISEEGSVIYFATKNCVYSIQLDATVPYITEWYHSNNEITHFSMFSQAAKLLSISGVSQLDTHRNMLILGTWDGSKGTLTTLPISNPATGETDNSNARNYEGFGKILTTVHHY